jgi:hypothetical protein
MKTFNEKEKNEKKPLTRSFLCFPKITTLFLILLPPTTYSEILWIIYFNPIDLPMYISALFLHSAFFLFVSWSTLYLLCLRLKVSEEKLICQSLFGKKELLKKDILSVDWKFYLTIEVIHGTGDKEVSLEGTKKQRAILDYFDYPKSGFD